MEFVSLVRNCKSHQFDRWRELGLDEGAILCPVRNGVLVAPRSRVNVSILAEVVQQGAVQATWTELPAL